MVNRLWQHHFGEGLVRTPDNFGMMGNEPTHPELLDWLAVRTGRRRLAAQAAAQDDHAVERLPDGLHAPARSANTPATDFANELWWRRNRLRLEAEPLRDAMLATSGQLNLEAGGPSFFPPISREALEGLSKKGDAWGTSPPEEQRRRSIYMMTKRSLLLPLMTTFDFADTTQPCSQRNISTVAPQALALLNNDFVHEQSQAFAERVLPRSRRRSGRADRAGLVAGPVPPADRQRATRWRTALADPAANMAERAAAGGATLSGGKADRQALASLCHVLLNLNEFIYVD